MTLVGLDASAGADLVGVKFARLAEAAAEVPVPWACCAPTAWLARSLGDDRLGWLAQVMLELKATLGCGLLAATPRIDAILDGLVLLDEQRRELDDALQSRAASPAGYVVRSSPASDDSVRSLDAGAYATTAGASTPGEVAAAVVACWRGAFAPQALAARMRSGDWSPHPALAVMIQDAVQPTRRGVTLADGAGRRTTVLDPATTLAADAVAEAEAAATLIAARRGVPVEVEWLWEQSLQVVQIRTVDRVVPPRAQYRVAPLYGDALPHDFELGDCASVYEHYVAKRKWAFDHAAAVGIATGAARVLSFNGSGLADNPGALRRDLASTAHEHVVLDVAPTVRQVITKKDDAVAFLVDAFGRASRAHHVDGAIIRDFVAGYGVIARVLADGSTVVEFAETGLMDLNRGVVAAERLELVEDDAAAAGAPRDLAGALPTICSFTRRLNAVAPGVQTEWAVVAGEPHFIDFSVAAAPSRAGAAVAYVVSRGWACGPAVVLDDDMLRPLSIAPALSARETDPGAAAAVVDRLSERVRSSPRRPIVVARRPYAILASLIDDAEGFVFEAGSVLCHLAITLRELGCPAVVSDVPISNGDELELDDGRLIVLDGRRARSHPHERGGPQC